MSDDEQSTAGSAANCFLRVANARVARSFRQLGSKFSLHPVDDADSHPLAATVAYASRNSMHQLGLKPGDFLSIRQSEAVLVAQVWLEEGFWTVPASDKPDALPELFLGDLDLQRVHFSAEATVRATRSSVVRLRRLAQGLCRRVDPRALAAWDEICVVLDGAVSRAALPDPHLLLAKLQHKTVVERRESGTAFLKNGHKAFARLHCARLPSNNADAVLLGRVDIHTRVRVMDSVEYQLVLQKDSVVLFGQHSKRLSRLLAHMFANQFTLRQSGVAFDVKALLLLGASGCGKTSIGRAIVRQQGIHLLDCSLRSLLSLNPDDAGSALLRQFDAALQLQPSRACLFLDDIDKLLPNAVEQEVDDDTSAQVLFALQQIFHRLRSCQSASNIVLIGTAVSASSRVLSRFGRKLFVDTVDIAPPTPLERRQLTRAVLTRLLSAAQLDAVAASIDEFSDRCHGYLPCDTQQVCLDAIRTAHRSGTELSLAHLEQARMASKPSLLADVTVSPIDVRGAVRDTASSTLATPASIVAGLAAPQRALRESLAALSGAKRAALKALGAAAPNGVLLYGPPGCGKTLIARQAAMGSTFDDGAFGNFASTWHFAHLDAAQLTHSSIGEGEKRLAAAFVRARTCAPCVLFIDEIEALFGDRGEVGESSRKMISQLLLEFDELSDESGVLVVGATNLPNKIDKSLLRPGRFDRLIYVPPPNADERKALLHMYAKKLRLSQQFFHREQEILLRCSGFSGADMKSLCNKAALQAVFRCGRASNVDFVTPDDFLVALSQTNASISQAMVHSYNEWQKSQQLARAI